MRKPITPYTKIVPVLETVWGECISPWRLKMESEGIDEIHHELAKYHGYLQRAGKDDIIPGEVEFGKTYLYFRDQKAYNWFTIRWGA